MAEDVHAIDVNDLNLVPEALPFDPHADLGQFAAPPPESGNPYLCQARLGTRGWLEKKVTDQQTQQSRVLWRGAHVELTLIGDGAFKDRKLFDNPTTAKMGDSHRLAYLLTFGFRETLTGAESDVELLRRLKAHLDREDRIWITLQWRGYCKPCDLEIKGERGFPQDGNGKRLSVMPCPGNPGRPCGQEISANAQVRKYAPA